MDAVVTSTKTGLLIAAERGRNIAFAKTIDRYCARPNRPRPTQGPFDIGRKDRRREAVFRIVCQCDGLIDCGNGEDRQDRPKDFFTHLWRIQIGHVQNGWLDKPVLRCTAHQGRRTLFQIGANLIEMGLGH